MRVQFTPAARRQLLDAIAYIGRDKPSAARRYRARAEKALRRLGKFPESGRQIPEFPDLAFREIVVDSHRYFYRVVANAVWIVGVWHGAQNPRLPMPEP